MSDAIAFQPPVAVPIGTLDDDLVLDRLTTWLAEVSAEAAVRSSSLDVEPPRSETAS